MNNRLLKAVRIFLLLALLASFSFVSTPAFAEGTGPQVKVIATGLNNPRGMTFGPDGALYVAEAGVGGTDCVETPPENEGEEPGQICFGLTGAVTRIARGHQVRIFKNIPSLTGGPEGISATGAHDVAFTLAGLRVVTGLGADPAVRDTVVPAKYKYLGYLGQMLWGKKFTPVVDVAGYEALNNPEPTMVDSNPYAVINDGSKGIVVDAGGNSLLQVDRGGKISTLAIFPARLVDVPPDFPIPLPPQFPMETVPNSLVKGPDGAYYVGSLGGFPFLPGESDIYRVVPGQPVEVFAEGFTSTIDIAFDKKGNLYVLEMVANGLLAGEMGGDWTGALFRVNTDGTRDEIMTEGLWAPTGMAIGRDGYIYVANNGIFPGEGEILKIRP